MSFRNVCFTIIDDNLRDIPWNAVDMHYLVYQEEIAPETGKHHLQGFVQLKKNMRLKKIKELLGSNSAHCEKMKGTPEEAAAYCKKEDSRAPAGLRFEGGELRRQGQRMDLRAVIDLVGEGKDKFDLLTEGHETVVARHPQFVDMLVDRKQELDGKAALQELFEDAKLRPWQSDLLDELRDRPDPRKVMWVYETKGNTGKSWFARYLVAKRDDVFLASPGKLADLAYLWSKTSPRTRIVVFDVPRTLEANEKYDPLRPCLQFAEMVKNGVVQSTKYQPKLVLRGVPHVIFLANFAPTLSSLSMDRWDLRTVSEAGSLVDEVVIE